MLWIIFMVWALVFAGLQVRSGYRGTDYDYGFIVEYSIYDYEFIVEHSILNLAWPIVLVAWLLINVIYLPYIYGKKWKHVIETSKASNKTP